MVRTWIWSMIVLGLTVIGATGALAAVSPASTSSISAGVGSVAACDPAPSWSYAFTKNANGEVSSLSISNIAPACAGGSMRVTVAGPSLASTGTPTVISDCGGTCAVTVPFESALLFGSQIATANALIVGP